MSLRMPILTVICCAWALTQASAAPNAAPIAGRPNNRFIVYLPRLLLEHDLVRKPVPTFRDHALVFAPVTGASHTEIVVQLFDVRVQVGIAEPVGDPSVFHDVVPVG